MKENGRKETDEWRKREKVWNKENEICLVCVCTCVKTAR